MMFVLGKPIAELKLADIQALIDNQVVEGKHIDFKKDTYGGKSDDRKEFLKDISSFANAGGGEIIIGLEEDKGTGMAKAICPLAVKPDEEIRRLSSIAGTGLDPRLPSLEFQEIDIT